MINCNPETVSTDYDTSDRLYFEPLTFEDVSAVLDNERPDGVLVQFGGQTPLEARAAARGGGLSDLGHLARVDRPRRGPRPLRARCSASSALAAPPHAEARDRGGGARGRPRRIGYPLVVRPSYVLGGRAMAVVFDEARLDVVRRAARRELAASTRS